MLTDERGFPYYRGSTFKGVFREEMARVLAWERKDSSGELEILFGEGRPGADSSEENRRRLVFSDFVLSSGVRETIREEIGDNPGQILACLSNMRAFTQISRDGTAEKGSLRYARCINKGLIFYSTILCSAEDAENIIETLSFVKWIGTMRNRGFGNVRIEAAREHKGPDPDQAG